MVLPRLKDNMAPRLPPSTGRPKVTPLSLDTRRRTALLLQLVNV